MSRIRTAVLAAAMLALPFVQTPAQASPNVGQAVGTGTISPGLPGCSQTVTFSGQVVLVGTHAGVYPVTFNGRSFGCETELEGAGTGTLTGGISGTVNYTRAANVVTLSGSVTVAGTSHTLLVAECQFVPTTRNPTTTYVLHCDLAIG